MRRTYVVYSVVLTALVWAMASASSSAGDYLSGSYARHVGGCDCCGGGMHIGHVSYNKNKIKNKINGCQTGGSCQASSGCASSGGQGGCSEKTSQSGCNQESGYSQSSGCCQSSGCGQSSGCSQCGCGCASCCECSKFGGFGCKLGGCGCKGTLCEGCLKCDIGGHSEGMRAMRAMEREFNCGCNGSYKFPVPPLYTYHWIGMYSQELMTDYHSPWRFPPIKPFGTDELDDELPPAAVVPFGNAGRIQPVAATVVEEIISGADIEPMSKKMKRFYR